MGEDDRTEDRDSEAADGKVSGHLAERLGAGRVQLHALRLHALRDDAGEPELLMAHLDRVDREVTALARLVERPHDGTADPALVLDRLPVMAGYLDRDFGASLKEAA